jgi:hypothetical protein
MKGKMLRLLTLILLVLIGISCSQAAPSPIETPSPSSQPGTAVNPSSPPSVPAKPTVSWKADGIITPGEYAGVARYGDYSISWLTDETTIFIAVRAKTVGWVAVGIQPSTTMKDADIILGFVKDGKASVYDLYSTGSFGPHPRDTELGGTDDISEFGGKEEGGYTVIEFKRALKTADRFDKSLLKGSNKIIYSFGFADDIESRHIIRGYGQLDIQ